MANKERERFYICGKTLLDENGNEWYPWRIWLSKNVFIGIDPAQLIASGFLILILLAAFYWR